ALDLDRYKPDEPDGEVHRFAKLIGQRYPHLCIVNYHGQLRTQRTIKQPCEIFAMKKAMQATKAGIFAMMKASKPEVYEYELLAEFNYACTKMGILTPVHYPIIAAGENNFCIHYYGYQGQAKDGDMILVDCGAYQDNIWTDVSRTWPVNGQFNERQRQLYECAYKTSEYMFGIIKPGMPMADVDLTIRKHCYEYLRELKLVDTYENVGKLMWHGGAHHVGYDVHDEVDVPGDRLLEAGMIFCVDVGIYCEDWGIGFRLEDNCLVTEDGCINLSAAIPRSIEEIEAVFHNV
ncbi:MAG: M24 family metallopeptidase, partial [Defluviitaleaceae bacterium]|nr:M24 family metallopeptidase [Defluviitaleaceae bacterium]